MTKHNINIPTHNVLGTTTVSAYTGNVITDNDGNSLIYSKDGMIRQIDEFNKYITDEYIKESCNVKPDEFRRRLTNLKDFVNSLDDTKVETILACLQRYESGLIRSTDMPVKMTGITTYDGDGCWCRIASIEISALPYRQDELTGENSPFTWVKTAKLEKVFELCFTTHRLFDKSDKPVVDNNGNFNKIEYKRNSYLKPDTLVPGHLYKDAKDKEYLYIGTVGYHEADTFYNDSPIIGRTTMINGVPRVEEAVTLEKFRKERTAFRHYTFVTLNNKRKNDMLKAKTFKEWWKPVMEKCIKSQGCYDMAYIKISESFKVVEDLGEIFTTDNLKCNFIASAKTTKNICSENNTKEFEVFSRIIIPAIPAKTVYYTRWLDEKTGYGCFKHFNTSDEANKLLKDVKAKASNDKKYFCKKETYLTSITTNIVDGEDVPDNIYYNEIPDQYIPNED